MTYLYIWPKVFPANSLTPAEALDLTDSISSVLRCRPLFQYYLILIHCYYYVTAQPKRAIKTILNIAYIIFPGDRGRCSTHDESHTNKNESRCDSRCHPRHRSEHGGGGDYKKQENTNNKVFRLTSSNVFITPQHNWNCKEWQTNKGIKSLNR